MLHMPYIIPELLQPVQAIRRVHLRSLFWSLNQISWTDLCHLLYTKCIASNSLYPIKHFTV